MDRDMILYCRWTWHRIFWFIFSTAWILCTLAIAVCASMFSKSSCSLPGESITGYLRQPGDVVIGGTFMVHLNRVYNNLDFTMKPSVLQCQMFAVEYFQSMHALVFAVDEINSDPKLLPNITLGFHVFDTCFTLQKAAQGTLLLLSGGQKIIPNYNCHKGSPLAGIIGDSGTTGSILMAQILGLYRYPQISYFSTNPILSDRDSFPSFFRTIPSDEFQMRGLAQLVLHFGWSWVGLLATDNDYGQYGLLMAKQEIVKGGSCVAFSENILTGYPNRNGPHLAHVIKKSNTNVVIVISSEFDFAIVLEELLRQNVSGITWIASEGWATSNLLSHTRFQGILLGSIGFAIHSGQIPEFNKYLNSLHPIKSPNDLFIVEFWEQVFLCKWFNPEILPTYVANSTIKKCTGNEKLGNLLTEEDHRVSLNVYNAVYAIAWAFQSLCNSGSGPHHPVACRNFSLFFPWQLLFYIKNVNFKTQDKSQTFFDPKGNPPAIYDIVNWRLSVKGKLEHFVISSYDLKDIHGKIFNPGSAEITWINNSAQVPISKCSPICSPGFRKVIVPGKPSCCYECVQCPKGEISNQTDAVECHPCSWDTWPNQQQGECIPRATEFLSYEEPLGYSLAASSIFSTLTPIFILGVFIHHKKTPIVRANNYPLSCLLLISLLLCFLCSLGFIGYPQTGKCLLRQVAFGLVFTLCISCVLSKTITVVIAFTTTKPGSKLKYWTGLKTPYLIVIVCMFAQLCICGTWLIFSPPFSELKADIIQGVIIINCNEGLPAAFWCMLGYLGLLATISFIVAFLTRQLPDSFNEAKYITFSMLAFLSVWVSFIPPYLSARGKYTVALEVFAILSSTWAVVVCIFVPKCFIVLFFPNMNSKEHIMGKNKIDPPLKLLPYRSK